MKVLSIFVLMACLQTTYSFCHDDEPSTFCSDDGAEVIRPKPTYFYKYIFPFIPARWTAYEHRIWKVFFDNQNKIMRSSNGDDYSSKGFEVLFVRNPKSEICCLLSLGSDTVKMINITQSLNKETFNRYSQVDETTYTPADD